MRLLSLLIALSLATPVAASAQILPVPKNDAMTERSRYVASVLQAASGTLTKWTEAVSHGDTSALPDLYTEDAKYYGPEGKQATGPSEITAEVAQELMGNTLTTSFGDFETSGNMAALLGRFTLNPPEGTGARNGVYVIIFMHHSGAWRIRSQMFTLLPPESKG